MKPKEEIHDILGCLFEDLLIFFLKKLKIC